MTESVDANPTTGTEQARPIHTVLGWIGVALSIGYATFTYYGLAPPPGGMPTDWWHPRTFMLDWPTVGGWVDRPVFGATMVAIPGVVIAFGVFATTRSAVARALAVSYALVAFYFGLAGFGAQLAWAFFDWRFTAVLELSGLAMGFALTSPLLARSWLRLPPAVQLALYAPLFFAVMAAIRGATGTNEHLPFLVSPWPTFTGFGLQTGVYLVSGFLFAIALGLVSISKGIAGRPRAILGLVIAIALPAAWISIGITRLDAAGVAVISVLSAAAIGVAALLRGAGERHERLRVRGLHLGAGAAMAFLPVFAGSALAKWDYDFNRNVLSPRVIDALQRHMEKEEFYPATLYQLLEGGYLDEEPAPRIGFGFLADLCLDEQCVSDPVEYRYNEYGSSFVLEFDSTLWIQCAYSGHYIYPEELDEYSEEELAELQAESDWSCLAKQPALFGGDSEPEPGEEESD